ncbi:MAG: hypothetical protein U1F76_04755 [Candidatus Competibacteraceae bacterium]
MTIGLLIAALILTAGLILLGKGDKTGLILLALALFIGAGFWWNAARQQNYQAALTALEKAGFHADERLEGNPYVVFDTRRRKIAIISSGTTRIYNYKDIIRSEWVVDEASGWKDKSVPVRSYRLLLEPRGQAPIAVAVSEESATAWRGKLEKLLKD